MSKSDNNEEDKIPVFWATTTYKLWVREQLERTGLSFEEFARKLKEIDRDAKASSGGLSQFIGPKGTIPSGSNTTLMPAINKLFGQPPPPVCDPTDPLAVIRDRITSKWSQLTETERRVVMTVIGTGPTTDPDDGD